MKNITHQELNLPARAPVMALPGALLFPNALLPLFIFEPRYRAMLSWSLEQHRMFCIAPMKPGLSEARSADDFHHVVGLGLVRACVGHDDGTSHLVLQGLARVRIIGFERETPFRLAEIEELPSRPVDEHSAEELTARLLEAYAQLSSHGLPIPEALDKQLAQIDDPSVLSDVLACTFLRDTERRQEVFEALEVPRRAELLIRHLHEEMSESDGPS